MQLNNLRRFLRRKQKKNYIYSSPISWALARFPFPRGKILFFFFFFTRARPIFILLLCNINIRGLKLICGKAIFFIKKKIRKSNAHAFITILVGREIIKHYILRGARRIWNFSLYIYYKKAWAHFKLLFYGVVKLIFFLHHSCWTIT